MVTRLPKQMREGACEMDDMLPRSARNLKDRAGRGQNTRQHVCNCIPITGRSGRMALGLWPGVEGEGLGIGHLAASGISGGCQTSSDLRWERCGTNGMAETLRAMRLPPTSVSSRVSGALCAAAT